MLKNLFKSSPKKIKKYNEKLLHSMEKEKTSYHKVKEEHDTLVARQEREYKMLNGKVTPESKKRFKEISKLHKKLVKQKEAIVKMSKKFKIENGKVIPNKPNQLAPAPLPPAQQVAPEPVQQPVQQPAPREEVQDVDGPIEIPTGLEPLTVEADIVQQQADLAQVNAQLAEQKRAQDVIDREQQVAYQQAQAQQVHIHAEQIRQDAYAEAYAQAQSDLAQQVQQPAQPTMHSVVLSIYDEDAITVQVIEQELPGLYTSLQEAVNNKTVIVIGEIHVNGAYIVKWELEE